MSQVRRGLTLVEVLVDDEARSHKKALGRHAVIHPDIPTVRNVGFHTPLWALADAHRIADLGVFELTGYGEGDLLGKPLVDAFGLSGFSAEANPVSVVMEWGVRKLDQPLVLRHRSGREKAARVDLFPAYDEDGGLLASLAPRLD
jgi:hypothetical protein